jgi:hypothetical protein
MGNTPDVAALHRRFLDAYGVADWTQLPPDETYLLNRLAYHLVRADRSAELRCLFADDRWLQVRVPHDGYVYDGYITDLMTAWQVAYGEAEQQIRFEQSDGTLAECVGYALIRTSINSLTANYVPELVVQAVKLRLENWSPARATSILRNMLDSESRAELSRLLLALADPDLDRFTIGSIAFATAEAISDERYQARALAALAPHLPPGLLAQALKAAEAIANEGYRAQALAALAPHLPPDLLSQALKAAEAVSDEEVRAEELVILLPHLPPDLLAQALKTAEAIRAERYRAKVLAALAPSLSPDLLTQALRAVEAIRDEWCRAWAMRVLALQLPPDQQQAILAQALKTAEAIQDEWERWQALAAFAPHLPPDLLAQALKMAEVISDEGDQAQVLTALAPHLPPDLLTQALKTAEAISDDSYRAQVLTALAPHLPPLSGVDF